MSLKGGGIWLERFKVQARANGMTPQQIEALVPQVRADLGTQRTSLRGLLPSRAKQDIINRYSTPQPIVVVNPMRRPGPHSWTPTPVSAERKRQREQETLVAQPIHLKSLLTSREEEEKRGKEKFKELQHKVNLTPTELDFIKKHIAWEKDRRKGIGLGKCRKCGLLKGRAMPEKLNYLQQMAKQSYNIVNPKEDINGWKLEKWTPTMKFWVKGKEVIVGVRGTKTTEDVMTWGTVPLNTLYTTTVYKRDKAAVQQFQQKYPQSEYTYYAVGHSLGGAIIDNLLRAGLIKEALSYNPAIQYSDINAGLPNYRIYYGSDPLYRLMGWWDKKSEHREPENRTWADFLSWYSLPAAAVAGLPAHKLENFEGGKKRRKNSIYLKVNEF